MKARWPRTRRDERGQTLVEFVLWTPVMFALLAAGVQWGMYLWARHVAETAAQTGAITAQDEYASDPGHWYADSRQAALGQITALAPKLLQNPSATPSQSGTTVTVTVTGEVPHILWSWFTPAIQISATGPIEQWSTP